MTNLAKLKALCVAAPAFPDELVPDDTAGYYECPCCSGEGAVDREWVTHARSNAWPGGAQFYGVGHEHQWAEQFYLEARKMMPALIAIAEAAQTVIAADTEESLYGAHDRLEAALDALLPAAPSAGEAHE